MIDTIGGLSLAGGAGRFELLIHTGFGWTPAERFRTRRSAARAARNDFGGREHIVEDTAASPPNSRPPWIAVIRLLDRYVIGVTRDPWIAATWLTPDTTHGMGLTKVAAREDAERSAARIVAFLIAREKASSQAPC